MKKIKCIYKKITSSGLLAALSVLAACSDQETAETFSPQGRVEFGVSTNEDWQGVSSWSKAKYGGGNTARYALRATDNAGEEYQLRATTLDGIRSRSRQAIATEEAETRGVPVTTENFSAQNEAFGFMSYAYTPTTQQTKAASTKSTTATPMQMVTLENGHYYSTQNAVWFDKSASYVRLYAVAPYSAEGMTVNAGSTSSVPTIAYEVPKRVEEQHDLLAVTKTLTQEDYGQRIDLTFNHVLTAVRFKVGDTPLRDGRIVKIVLKNVYTSGVYAMGETDGDLGSWSQLDGKGDFTQQVDFVTNGRTNEDVTPDDMQLMMIPQELDEDAKIYITFEIADSKTGEVGTRTISAALGGHTWGIGQTVTYAISSHLIDFDYDITAQSPAAFSYEGGAKTFSVQSYRYNYKDDSETAAAQWVVDAYSTDGGDTWSDERPSWIRSITLGGEGGAGAQDNARVAVAPADVTVGDVDGGNHVATLKAAAAKTNQDLSLCDADGNTLRSRCTANCYVLHAAGTYRFPMVYGNAYKDGQYNGTAFMDNVNDGIDAFVDYKDNAINWYGRTWLKSSATPHDAVIAWQDASSLVTDVAISGDYVTFRVPAETICPGNAVLAVRDADGNVMWSWHIWVTDHKPVAEQVGKGSYAFMPVVLGWADKSKRTFAGREALVRVRQASGKTATVRIVQEGSEEVFDPGSPYYQWGRKDPLPPAAGNKVDQGSTYGIDKPLYDNTYEFAFEQTATTIGNAIAHPCTMYAETSTWDWNANHAINLWSGNHNGGTGGSVVKSIYDPCPYGFSVPPMEAFADLTTENSVVGNNGRTFTMDNGKQLFLPFVGFRDETQQGRVYEFNEACNFWMAWGYGDDNYKLGRDFFVSNEQRGVEYTMCWYRGRARSLIPVVE